MLGSHIHAITVVFITGEAGLSIYHLISYISKPRDGQRIRLLMLLVSMTLYNIAGGVFPDPHYRLSIVTQMMIIYASGLIITFIFPFYFSSAYDLNVFCFGPLYLTPMFIALPALTFHLIFHFLKSGVTQSENYNILIATFPFLLLMSIKYKLCRNKEKLEADQSKFFEAAILYGFIGLWMTIATLGLVEDNQLLQVLGSNFGIVGITIICIKKSVDKAERTMHVLTIAGEPKANDHFQLACDMYKLTNREKEIVLLIRQGLTYRQISERLFISSKTVENHLQHIYEKTSANNKVAMLHKLSVAV